MYVLHIAPTPFFADRGCHIRIMSEIQAIRKKGSNASLVTYHLGRDIEGVSTYRTVNLPWYKKLDAGFSWHKFYADILLLLKSAAVFKNKKPDVIHGHLHEGALIGYMLSLLLTRGKTPVVADFQGSLTGELESYGVFAKYAFARRFFWHLEKWICELPDHIVCSSESTFEFLMKNCGLTANRLTLLPDGFLADHFIAADASALKRQLRIDANKKVVIYSGSLIPSKGVANLFEAIPMVLARQKNVQFVIIGYPFDSLTLDQKNLFSNESVIFLGKMDYLQLSKYLAFADIAIDPKTDLAGEGSGKSINYMAAGLPVVCFKTGNNFSFFGNNAYYAETAGARPLADAISKALDETERSRSMGDCNREVVMQRFSWDQNISILYDIYQKLIERGRDECFSNRRYGIYGKSIGAATAKR